jgi:hypothetical protein
MENLHQEQNPDDQLPGLSKFLLILEHLASLKSRSRYTAEMEIVQNGKINQHYQMFTESKN